MAILHQLALVSEVNAVGMSELSSVSAAVQKQVTRDFAPVWDVSATIDPFPSLDDIPLGYWPIIVRDDIGFAGAAGIHLDDNNQPYALVQHSNRWSLTASHEVLEMLADPFGNRLVAASSIKPGQGRVEYLIEVCDPSEDVRYAYAVNGVTVSDFYTPHFFDPAKTSGRRYSFTNAIRAPRKVLRNGYLSWRDPVSGHWWQQQYFTKKPVFKDLGVLSQSGGSLRSQIDRLTPVPEVFSGLPSKSPYLKAAALAASAVSKSANAKAKAWRAHIEALKSEFGPHAARRRR